jgi:hypothetical protein
MIASHLNTHFVKSMRMLPDCVMDRSRGFWKTCQGFVECPEWVMIDKTLSEHNESAFGVIARR